MRKKIHDVDINYVEYKNEKKDTIVLLHGWGQNIQMMTPLGDAFKKDYNIVIIDLPGFGKSSEPKEVFTIYDYADVVHELLNELKVKKPILIGHSFGGKISLVYASKYSVKKLILLASPFRPGIKKLSMKTKILKSIKKIPGMDKVAEKAKNHITMNKVIIDENQQKRHHPVS